MITAPTGQLNQVTYDVTDDGMIDDVSEVLPNANAPILVTLVGIVIDASDVHDMKAP